MRRAAPRGPITAMAVLSATPPVALLGSVRGGPGGLARPPLVFVRSGDLMVDFDDGRMRQVLVNLLGNAVQHSDASHPIRFELRGDGREVLASVSNREVPIPAGSIASIFDPMVQLAKSRPEPSQRPAISMGLGLFIAREIVKAHGAQIDFTSSTEQGAVFTIRMLRNRPSSC